MRFIPLTASAALALAIASPVSASDKDWNTASTIGVGALAAWSLGVPAVTGDGKGARSCPS